MENKNIYFTQKKFDEVWNRVTAAEPTDTETLKKLMEYEFTDYNIYRTLSQRYTGTLRLHFTEMAKDEMRHYSTLKAKYFLLTGKIYEPAHPAKFAQTDLKDILKTRYITECKAYEGYLKAAKSVSDTDLANLCLRNAEDEKQHAYTALTLLGSQLK